MTDQQSDGERPAAEHSAAERSSGKPRAGRRPEKGVVARFFTEKPRYTSDYVFIWASMTVVSVIVTGIYTVLAPDPLVYLREQGFMVLVISATAAIVMYLFHRGAKNRGELAEPRSDGLAEPRHEDER